MEETDVFLVTTTVDSEDEAEHLAQMMVEAQIAACVQITGPIISHYTWKGSQHRAKEWRCESKTLKHSLSRLIEFIRDNHPFENPELVAIRVSATTEPYHDWMESVLR